MSIIFLGIAWLAGIWLASVVELGFWTWVAIGAGSIFAAITLRRQVPAGMWLAMLGVLCLGAARFASAEPVIDENHIAYFNGRDDVAITGVVVDEPEIWDRFIQLKVKSEAIESRNGPIVPVTGILLVSLPRYGGAPYGARVRVTGRLQDPENFGEFDYKSFLARQGVHSQMSWPTVKVISEGHGNPIYYGIYAFKDKAQGTIKSLLPNPHAALLSGILLGNDNELSPDLDQAFRRTGMTHIIAISGFNIAILAAILLGVSRPVAGLRGSAWVALIGVALYTVLVGADAAVVRAAIMGGLFIIAARFMGRPTYAPAGLFAAAIAMTLVNPNILWDIGFQLSFAATLGLMLYVGPWSQWTEAVAQRILSPHLAKQLVIFLGDIAIATLAALLLTMPLMAYHFGQLSVVSPLANLFILPAQPGIMVWGILATLTGMVLQPLGQLLAWVDWLFLDYTIDRVRFFSTLPAASVEVAAPATALLAIYALIFGLTWLARRSRTQGQLSFESLGNVLKWSVVLSGLAIITWLIFSLAFSQHDGYLHVAFIDVGQGDATLITTPSGRQILVDGGAYPSVLKDELGQRLPFWRKNIDIIVATHPDSDHVAALPSLFEHYDIGRLITNGQDGPEASYQELLSAASRAGTPVHEASVGDVIIIDDGIRLEILNSSNPQSPIPNPHLDNNSSIALKLIYRSFSLLITGDAGAAAEGYMLAGGNDLASVVYKAGHHGSDTSSSRLLLTAVGPDIAVISSGVDNRYGHPHPAVLGRLGDVGAAVLRTDELGTIEVISDGEAMWWEAKP